MHMLIINSYSQTVLQSSFQFSSLPVVYESSSCSAFLSKLRKLSTIRLSGWLVSFSHFVGYVVVMHWGFDKHFLYVYWAWVPSHIYGHLDIVFYNLPIHVFCLFLFYFHFLVARDWTQDPANANHVLCHWITLSMLKIDLSVFLLLICTGFSYSLGIITCTYMQISFPSL